MQPPTPRTPVRARVVGTLLTALLVLTGALLPAATASAAVIGDGITSVTTDKTSYGYNERITLDFEWAVPDSAVAGDTFALELPDALKALTLAKFPLRAVDGSIVANAAWQGKTVVFTLTDYVDTHDSVAGNGFLTVQWDHVFTPETSAPIVLEFLTNAVEVVIGDKPTPNPPCTKDCPPPPATPTTRALAKSGGWSDGAYEGTRDLTGNINWSLRLPGNDTGFAGPIEIVDTPAAGSTIECTTIALVTQISLAGSAVKSPVDPARYTLTCSPTSFTITLDGIGAAEFITVTYKGTITDQESGAYGNHVSMTIAGTTTVKESVIRRQDAGGGTGGGVQSVSVGDFVWLDSDRDGIQGAGEPGIRGVTLTLTGPTGEPVTDVSGKPVGPVVTDADGRYSFDRLPLLPAGQHYTVTIDRDASPDALSGLEPTVEGAGDRAIDSSTWRAESSDLTLNGQRDATLDFGFVAVELPTLPLPADPAADGELAQTGIANPASAIAAALGLLIAGAAGLLIRRIRRA